MTLMPGPPFAFIERLAVADLDHRGQRGQQSEHENRSGNVEERRVVVARGLQVGTVTDGDTLKPTSASTPLMLAEVAWRFWPVSFWLSATVKLGGVDVEVARSVTVVRDDDVIGPRQRVSVALVLAGRAFRSCSTRNPHERSAVRNVARAVNERTT